MAADRRGQVGGGDQVAGGLGVSGIEDAGQLAEVPGPVVGAEDVESVGGKTEAAALLAEIGAFEGVLGQQGQFIEAVAQGEEADDESGQGEVEVVAEPAVAAGLVGIGGGGGQEADARRLQGGGEASLEVAGKFEDIAEQQRGALGQLEAGPFRRWVRAEQFAVEHLGGQGTGVEDEQRGLGARAAEVDRTGDQALARARFAHDQDRQRGRRGGGDLLQQATMRGPLADQGVGTVPGEQALTNLLQLGPEPLRGAVGGMGWGVGVTDEAEQADQAVLAVTQGPELQAPPLAFARGVDDQGRAAGGPAFEGLGRRAKAAAEPFEVAVATGAVGPTGEADHLVERTAGQLLPGAVDVGEPAFGIEQEDRLGGLLEQGIEPADADGAGGRHEWRGEGPTVREIGYPWATSWWAVLLAGSSGRKAGPAAFAADTRDSGSSGDLAKARKKMERPRRAVALDGGTTNTRARLIEDGRIVATTRRAVGARDTAFSGGPGPLAGAVRACLDELELLAGGPLGPIVAAGMLTAEVGLVAVPHAVAPAGLEELARGLAVRTLPELGGRTVSFIPGVRTPAGPGPDGWAEADVMRGEECETLGAWTLLGRPPGRRVFLWPGSHTKLVELDDAGRIARSHTTLAGELWAAVAGHTLLAASLPAAGAVPERPDPEALEAGRRLVERSGLARAAFAVRLAALGGALGPESRAAFWLGAVVADDAANLLRHPILAGSDPLVIGGRQPQRGLFTRWLKGRYAGPVEVLDDDQADRASALGALAIAERAR